MVDMEKVWKEGKARDATMGKGGILFYYTEPRDPERIFYSSYPERYKQLKAKKLIVTQKYETSEEYIVDMHRLVGMESIPYRGVFFDGLSYENTRVKLAFEDDRFEKEVGRKKRSEASLIDRYKLEWGDWGGSASIMIRITALLNSFADRHKCNVVATAWLDENPSWGRKYDYAFKFQGKEYPENVCGFFDLIGCAEEQGGYKFPPKLKLLQLEDDRYEYILKSSGATADMLKKLIARGGYGPLDFTKLIAAMTIPDMTERVGTSFLVYSAPGVGKTSSVLTLPVGTE